MAPIRRYLRITKYSVLEVRIYLDNPALASSWLLNPRNPVLPRVIESVRPLVLPKLREEKERNARKRSTKKKGIKDVVVEDDFEVSIFLTETSTRHSLLTKHKHFHDTTQTKLTSNSGRLIGATNEAPIDVDLAAELGGGPGSGNTVAGLRIEESDDDDPITALAAIPAIDKPELAAGGRSNIRSKRPRRSTQDRDDENVMKDTEVTSGGEYEESGNEEDEGLFVESDEAEISTMATPPAKRRKEDDTSAEDVSEDKKKMAMDITYEGFSIYGRVLCLVVKRREGKPSGGSATGTGGAGGKATKAGNGRGGNGAQAGKSGEPGGQAMMETFIMSTQVPAGAEG